MPVNKLVAFEAFFDRASAFLFVGLGLAAAGAVAFIGGYPARSGLPGAQTDGLNRVCNPPLRRPRRPTQR